MNYKQRKKEEQRKIIGIEPAIDMKHFVELLLADLASKDKNKFLGEKQKVFTACLSTDYKRIIEDIMYEENGWGIKFAELININSYYEFQIDWEIKLGATINKVVKELNKEITYDIISDLIMIDFTKEEINQIKSQYDETILKNMDHFSNLISNCIYNRRWKLEMLEMGRSKARYETHLEDLKLRTKYSQKVGIPIAKKLYK